MDSYGSAFMEEQVKTSNTLLQNDDSQFNSFEVPVNFVTEPLPLQESPEKLPSQDDFSDIFGDFSLISAKPNDSLFSLDEGGKDYSFPSWAHGDNSMIDNMEDTARNEGVSFNSSLFDDLLDFSSPRTSEIDNILKDNMANITPVPQVDLLCGVDGDLDTGSSPVQSEVKVNNPDILNFVEIPSDLPEVREVDSMDVTDGLTCDSLIDGWSLVREVSPSSPDIVVTSSDHDLDTARSEDIKKEIDEEKTDENIKENSVERADDNKDGGNNQDIIDFSVLELPESSNINFDHFKHKRNISQKGSIANRKKPKRSTIQHNTDDSFFLDSTEPKPQKLEDEDDKEVRSSPDDKKEDDTHEPESEVPEEVSPSRKPAGGMKIPGLLEGLSKSKAFNKVGKAPAEAEPDILPQVTFPAAASEKDISPTSPQATISSSFTNTPEFILPKPVILPRVLPKPTNKTLKETQNQTTAGGSVVRASSFKITSSGPDTAEKPSFLKGSTALSRSASVKITGASTNENLEQSSPKEQVKPSFGLSKLSPPTKPEIKSPLGPTSLKPQIKTPPPVPSKPLVAAKPSRTNLRPSASFAGVRSPLLSEAPATIPATISDSGILNGKNKTELTTTSSGDKLKSDYSLSTGNKPASYTFSSSRKPYSFGQKTVEVHSTATSDKTSVTAESTKSNSEELEFPKQAALTRIPSIKKTLQFGSVATTGFKPTETYTDVETKKTENLNIDDVFDTNSGFSDKNGTSISSPGSSSSCEKLDNTNIVEEFLQHRKSSISGIMSVKSPLSSDKPQTAAMPRKGSITGSAYNPIGFRSTLGSSDGEQRSRGSSFSSTVEAVPSVDSLPLSAPSPKPRDNSFGSSEGQRSRDGPLNRATPDCVRHTPDKLLDNVPAGKPEVKPASLAETKYTPSFQRRIVDDKKKEVASTMKMDVREPARALRKSTSPSTRNGSPEVTKGRVALDKKSSPWNVQLKKVEKKEPVKPEAVIKTEDPPPINWRQQLSVRSRNPPPTKDVEKPKPDNTPDWAKASIKRRQRLIDSGVIRSDS